MEKENFVTKMLTVCSMLQVTRKLHIYKTIIILWWVLTFILLSGILVNVFWDMLAVERKEIVEIHVKACAEIRYCIENCIGDRHFYSSLILGHLLEGSQWYSLLSVCWIMGRWWLWEEIWVCLHCRRYGINIQWYWYS